MAIVTTDNKNYQDIADKIRSLAGVETTYEPSEMPTGIESVYQKGQEAANEAFWGLYLNYGNPKYITYAFAGTGWNNNTFYPKYNIVASASSANGMFRTCDITDLAGRLEECGVTLDISKASGLQYLTSYSKITHFPVLDSSGTTILREVVASSDRLVTIDKFILRNSGDQTFDRVFVSCNALQNLVIEGTIGQNGFNVQWCPLTFDSLVSIVNALADKTGDTSGTDWLITLGQANIATLGSDTGRITAKGWRYE